MRQSVPSSGSDSDDFDCEQEVSVRVPLAELFVQNFERSTFGDGTAKFLPNDCINDLLTKEVIREELEFDPHSRTREDVVEWVYNEARKIFSILIHCDVPLKTRVKAVKRFKRNNFGDSCLPVGFPEQQSSSEDPPRWAPPEPFRVKGSDGRLYWTVFRFHKFYENQFKFLSPVFSSRQYKYDLAPECILPFIWKDESVKEGAFSCVYRVRVHEAHQEHVFTEVAVKEIRVNRGTDKIGTDKAWNDEAMALEDINRLDHDNIIKCIAAVRRGDNRYFVFPWANGGSLRDFWEASPRQSPKANIIRQTVVQLRGLAHALSHLHNFAGRGNIVESEGSNSTIPDVRLEDDAVMYPDEANSQSIRHGDLKPENILRFLSDPALTKDREDLGILKIADMGLAKHHVVATQERNCLTSTRYGTLRYEAPETVTALARSRLYDIWSVGCIVFEFIIWILHGNDVLNTFYNQVKGETQQFCQYFELHNDGRTAEVHSVVRRWMNHIENNDPECSRESAIRDLLELVRTKLLVVALPPRSSSNAQGETMFKSGPYLIPPEAGESKRNYRTTAENLLESLDTIALKLKDEEYLVTRKKRDKVTVPVTVAKTNFLSPQNTPRPQGNVVPIIEAPTGQISTLNASRTMKADYSLPPLEAWEFPVDNKFAEKVLTRLGSKAREPRRSRPATLCQNCTLKDFWQGGFFLEDRIIDLQRRSKECDFCRMLLGIHTKYGSDKATQVRFERNESTFRLSGGHSLPVLSILRSPELRPPLPIQLGFPELLEPGTEDFFLLIRLWLQDCNDNHPDCQTLEHTALPTRLIDVGSREAPSLRLLETSKERPTDTRYIALSHPWGDRHKHPPFCTRRHDTTSQGRDLESFKRSIPFEQLPATFKDAVNTTWALGIRYLWIDSLCILQGDNGDFNEQAKYMEDVFSCAYCVIAASRAAGQHDGFLKERPQRDYLTFKRGTEKPFYMCQPIDDFSEHVLEGSLNSRGWVLQERALARRTVFFTEHQTYFECGKGIRCETLAKMHNNMAAFLGDPRFPYKALNSSRGLKIRYFQDLYKQYSRLHFTNIEDRPFAIEGLENRLRKAYGTKGGFGIFDDGSGRGLFHRSLLWRRGYDEPLPGLSNIIFPPERNILVPSWSWMGYKGGIDYLDPEFEKTEWEKNDIHPPWTRSDSGPMINRAETFHEDTGIELVATVRDYNVAGYRDEEVEIVYDMERNRSDGSKPQCVIVAKSKDGKSDRERKHYVLIVVATSLHGAGGNKVYERIGAGHLLGKYIMLDELGTSVRIR